MAEFTATLTDKHVEFINQQHVFFVATAAATGRINLSPKGMDSFRVIDPATVAYLDVGGSGNETHAHLGADDRATIMFCAFSQPPLILRIYAHGVAVLPQDDGWDELAALFTLLPGTRQIFRFNVESVQTSCGWGVPLMSYDRDRETLSKFHRSVDPVERLAKIADRTTSLDGLPLRIQSYIPAAPDHG